MAKNAVGLIVEAAQDDATGRRAREILGIELEKGTDCVGGNLGASALMLGPHIPLESISPSLVGMMAVVTADLLALARMCFVLAAQEKGKVTIQ